MDKHPNVWFEYKHQDRSYYYYTVSQKTQYERPPPPAIIMPGLEGFVHKIMIQQNINDFTGQAKKQGPKGANLFIFHLPNDWSKEISFYEVILLEESDLVQHFQNFGTIVSARIMTDPLGKSKGFGFVSYEKPESANSAIKEMNGFKCSGTKKHLKVKLKQGEDGMNPRFMHKQFNPLM